MEKISPEKIVEVLKKHGTEVSIDQAGKILEILNTLAEIAVAIYLTRQRNTK